MSIRSTWHHWLTKHTRSERLLVVLPLLGVSLSEGLLYLGHPSYALGGHLTTLLLSTLLPLYIPDEEYVCSALAFLPVFRLVHLGMPPFFEAPLLSLVLVYGTLAPAVLLMGHVHPVDVEIGLREALLYLPVALFLALELAKIEFIVLQPEPMIPAVTPTQVALLGIVMFGFIGLTEELLFRGVVQRSLEAQIGPSLGILLTSAVFAMMHAGYANVHELGFAFVSGLVLGICYERTDSIALVIVLHGVLNVLLFGIIPHEQSILRTGFVSIGFLT